MGRGGCAEAPGGAERRRGRAPRSGLGGLGSHLRRLPSVPPAPRFRGGGGEEEPRGTAAPSRSASIPSAGVGVSEPPESRRARPGEPLLSGPPTAGPCHPGTLWVPILGSEGAERGGAGRAVRGARGRTRSRGMRRKGDEGTGVGQAGLGDGRDGVRAPSLHRGLLAPACSVCCTAAQGCALHTPRCAMHAAQTHTALVLLTPCTAAHTNALPACTTKMLDAPRSSVCCTHTPQTCHTRAPTCVTYSSSVDVPHPQCHYMTHTRVAHLLQIWFYKHTCMCCSPCTDTA